MSAADDLAEDDLDKAEPTAGAAKAAVKPAAKPAKPRARSSATRAKPAPKPAPASEAAPAKRGAKAGAEARPVAAAKAKTSPATNPRPKPAKAAPKSAAKPHARPGKPTPAAKAIAPPKASAGATPVAQTAPAAVAASAPAMANRAAANATVPDTWTAADKDALRWTSMVMVIVPVFLLLFNAASLKNWADQLAPSPTTVVVKNAADGWEAATRRVGLSTPRDALHNAWNRAVALKWDGTSGEGADPR